DDLGHADLDSAGRRVARLRASGVTLAPDESARLAAQSAQLVGPPARVFEGDALPGAWRVADPSLVHVVPRSHQLTVEPPVPGAVPMLPLAGGGRGLTVTIDGEVVRTEWGSNIRFRLGPRDRDAPGGVELEIGARGGGGVYHRDYICFGTYPSGK